MDERRWAWNSPPGWPLPPPGWTPPAGWTPPPEWPPAPQGWQFWVPGGATGDVTAGPAEPAPPATPSWPTAAAYPPAPAAGPGWGGAPPGTPGGWPYGWQGAAPAKRRTNGLAIASLVLSIIWLAGLGSILAIVFALVSRRQIRASKGAESGEGMALAGLIVGIVGVIGLAGVVVVLVVLLTPRTVELHYGQTAVFPTVSVANADGVASMTVESVAAPVTSPDTSVPAVPGEELAVATVQLCANGTGVGNRSLTFELDLLLPSGRTAVPYLDARTPSLNDLSNLGPHQCGVGYVTYEIAVGQAVQGIRYHVILPNRDYVWRP